ncbi:MAG: hypothetical protein WAQ08_21635 [Aquabacterium sp.]|uniref:hypothetical protein n=1 Tax=Aquabacterium sp. TaxID=1872578 RepID=UPI003BB10B1C
MKERPILFNGAMVRATRAGIKRMTRRVCQGQREQSCAHDFQVDRCPYGRPGDRLWVRENGWERPERTAKMLREGADTWAPYYYDADGIGDQEAAELKGWGFKRRPSIHMPRWASRITLEIVDVRVERLHDISDEDAIAEGIEPDVQPGDCVPLWRNYLSGGTTVIPRRSFETLWKTINGAASWDADPWLWVVEFTPITQ